MHSWRCSQQWARLAECVAFCTCFNHFSFIAHVCAWSLMENNRRNATALSNYAFIHFLSLSLARLFATRSPRRLQQQNGKHNKKRKILKSNKLNNFIDVSQKLSMKCLNKQFINTTTMGFYSGFHVNLIKVARAFFINFPLSLTLEMFTQFLCSILW